MSRIDRARRKLAGKLEEHVKRCFREANGQPPSPLYHYTSPAGFRGIITTRSLWATDFRHVRGDPDELHHAEEAILDAVSSLSKEYGSRSLPRRVCDHFGTEFRRLPASGLPDMRIYLGCFCTQVDDAELWPEYGEGGSGLSIGLPILRESHAHAASAMLMRVSYDVEGQARLFADQARSTLRLVQNSELFNDTPTGTECTVNLLTLAAHFCCCTKKPKYASENEWRMVVQTRDPPQDLEFNDSAARPYLVWPLRDAGRLPALSSVHVGGSSAMNRDEVREFLAQEGYGTEGNEPMPEIITSAAARTSKG